MLAPLSWLKEYVEIDVTAEQLQEKLFGAGFEVEELIEVGRDISGVVVGQVISCDLIPDTHIHVCKVDCGPHGVLQICCGADNVAVGGKYPVALVGATVYQTARDHETIEGVMTIKKGKLRGEESNGMLCSGVEIGLNEDLYPGAGYCGLLVLPEDAVPGADVKPIVGLDDYIFDIGLTANRPDCQSMIGMAREVAAVLKKEFKMPPLDYKESGKQIDFTVKVEAPDLCPRYIGHYVSDITLGPSPAKMRRLLALVGIRSISNIVDITNFVLKEFGQPMHAFDLRMLENHSIIVRRARKGEKIVTLDEKEFTLSEEHLVICDGQKPVALAGIMGGLNSEITDDTQEVFFEAAKFARDNIRRTSRALGQSSDSSARYEKGVDEYSTILGMRRALHLIDQLGCGKVSSTHIVAAAGDEPTAHALEVSVTKLNNLLGITVPEAEIIRHLAALDFAPEIHGDTLRVMVPPYREDIDGHVSDIAEEVIRSYGYEHITPRFLSTASVTAGGRNDAQRLALRLKNVLVRQGYYESVFYSFYSPKDFDMLHLPQDAPERKAIKILNPISEDLSVMRTMLTPSMLHAVVRNLRRGNTEGRFFELGRTFLADTLPPVEYPKENSVLCIGSFGEKENFFTAKGAVEAIAENFGLTFEYKKAARPYLHPGMTAEIYAGERCVGVIGALAHDVAAELAIEKPVFLTEIDMDSLLPKLSERIVYRPLPRFAAESRDLALVMDEAVCCGEVQKAIASCCKYIKSVTLFDVYRDALRIGAGKKSMAFTIVFSPEDHEFTGKEIDKYIDKILRKLQHTMNISLR